MRNLIQYFLGSLNVDLLIQINYTNATNPGSLQTVPNPWHRSIGHGVYMARVASHIKEHSPHIDSCAGTPKLHSSQL